VSRGLAGSWSVCPWLGPLAPRGGGGASSVVRVRHMVRSALAGTCLIELRAADSSPFFRHDGSGRPVVALCGGVGAPNSRPKQNPPPFGARAFGSASA